MGDKVNERHNLIDQIVKESDTLKKYPDLQRNLRTCSLVSSKSLSPDGRSSERKELNIDSGESNACSAPRGDGSNSSANSYKSMDLKGTMLGPLKHIEFISLDNFSEVPLLYELAIGKSLSEKDISPVLGKLTAHLIEKNVDAEIAKKIVAKVAVKLEGKVFEEIRVLRPALALAVEESLNAILAPKSEVTILMKALEAKLKQNLFFAAFCGVNGVGMSSTLAKVSLWLIQNGLKVVIAGYDTGSKDGLEKYRTHVANISKVCDCEDEIPRVQMFEPQVSNEAAQVAADANMYAKGQGVDVVLMGLSGPREEDNTPLIKVLEKLIRVNDPDLVLFIGDALTGNQAVDQLVEFNRALAEVSDPVHPRLIDGIVLTKFDQIGHKVGSAISMTYATSQPIVCVGTGAMYNNLCAVDCKDFAAALLN